MAEVASRKGIGKMAKKHQAQMILRSEKLSREDLAGMLSEISNDLGMSSDLEILIIDDMEDTDG
jgi:hypothetical protein